MSISNVNIDFQNNLTKNNTDLNKDYKGTSLNGKDTFSKILNTKNSEKRPQYNNDKSLKNSQSENSSVKDLKSYKNETIKTDNNDENINNEDINNEKINEDDISNIIDILKSLMNSDQVNLEIKAEIKELIKVMTSSTNSGVENILPESSSVFSKDNSNLQQLISILNKVNNESLGTDIQNSLKSLLKVITSESLKDSNATEVNTDKSTENGLENKLISKLKEILQNDNFKNTISQVEENKSLAELKPHNNVFVSSDKENKVSDKKMFNEENILDKLIEGDKVDSKISRVTTLASSIGDSRFNLDTIHIGKDTPIFLSKTNLNEDIIKAIKFMNVNNMKDLSVKIYPKELGEVVISVTMEQGAMKAMIKATNKDTVDLLNLGLRDLSDKLNNNNIKVQSLDISLYNEDTTYFSKEGNNGQQQQFNEKNSKKFNFDVEEEKTTGTYEDEGSVNILI